MVNNNRGTTTANNNDNNNDLSIAKRMWLPAGGQKEPSKWTVSNSVGFNPFKN